MDIDNISNLLSNMSLNNEYSILTPKQINMLNNDNITKIVVIKEDKDYTIINRLPKYLTHLHFHDECSYNYPIDMILPDTLEYLKLSWNYNKIFNRFPLSLKYLILGYSYNTQLYNLPNSLIYLKLGSSYNNSLYDLTFLLMSYYGYSSIFDT